MNADVTDLLGQRGEYIFFNLISRFHAANAAPIFRPTFLGDKGPSLDFIVHLIGVRASVPFFFVQVKSTRRGYTKKLHRLRVAVSESTVRRIISYPAPTYIAGIDEIGEKGYIVSANGENRSSLSSLSTKFPITERNRLILWNEVRQYWRNTTASLDKSRFIDDDWR